MQRLDYLKAARFSGPEAGDFLQAQLSADVGALDIGDATFACYCSVRGQVFGLLLVARDENGYLVAGSKDLLPVMMQRLQMFVFRAKVEFAVDEVLSVYGSLETVASAGAQLFVPGSAGLGYVFSEEAPDDGTDAQQPFRREELLRQVSWLDERTTEKYIPQMLGFDQLGAVSFSKGCYPGQEIVARARYLGKVKRKPYVVSITAETPIESGERVEIQKGNQWSNGTVVDSFPNGDEPGVLMIVAASEPEEPVAAVRFQDILYRCATT